MESIKETLQLILDENVQLANKINQDEVDKLIQSIKETKTVFVMGTGRSGLALKMAAMRLMHVGLNVQIVGDTLTPAILPGELLLAASGSGTTTSVVNIAEKAKKQEAKVIAITAGTGSRLEEIADYTVHIPAATKTDFGQESSAQYAGSLFEQFIIFLFEAVFMILWKESGLTKEQLWPRHANLE